MIDQGRPLSNPRYEALAIALAAGVKRKFAYMEVFPDCSKASASGSCSRLLRMNPDILERVEQIMLQGADKVTDKLAHVATTKEFIDDELRENLEHAKQFGTMIKDPGGNVIGYERNHTAVNATLKLLAEINGFTAKAAADKKRQEHDEDAPLTPDQLVLKIIAMRQQRGGLTDGERTALNELGAAATAELGLGAGPAPATRDLRSVSEAEVVPSGGD